MDRRRKRRRQEYRRGGGPSSGIWRTTDGGDTWHAITTGLPTGPVGRIGLALAESNPNVTSFIEDASGVLWIGTFGDGLNAMNRETARVRSETEVLKMRADVVGGDRITHDPGVAQALGGVTSLEEVLRVTQEEV